MKMKKLYFLSLLLALSFVGFSQKSEVNRPVNTSYTNTSPLLHGEEKWNGGGVFEGVKKSDEYPEKRTLISKSFKTSDSTNMVMLGQFHYEEDGQFKDIDLNISPSSSQDFPYENLTNIYKSRFADNVADGLHLTYKGRYWTLGLLPKLIIDGETRTVGDGAPAKRTNLLEYSDGQTAIRYELLEFQMYHNTIFHTPDVFAGVENDVIYEEIIQLPKGITLQDEEGNVINDGADVKVVNLMQDGEFYASLVQPRIWDSSLDDNPMNLKENRDNFQFLTTRITYLEDNKIRYAIALNKDWLQNENRVYPVYLDPTITFEDLMFVYSYQYPFLTDVRQRVSEVLWRSSMIGQSGTITKVGYFQTQNNTYDNENISISMKHVSYSSITNENFESDLTLVEFDSDRNLTSSGWEEFNLSTDFNYNGINNLIIQTRFINGPNNYIYNSTGGTYSVIAPYNSHRRGYSYDTYLPSYNTTNYGNQTPYMSFEISDLASHDVTTSGEGVDPSLVGPGGNIDVECDHDYSGTATSNFDTSVGYYLSTDCVWDNFDTLLGYSDSTIGSDPSDPESETLPIPANTAPGNYYILFVADYTNTVPEGSGEYNNVRCFAITVQAESSNDVTTSEESVNPDVVDEGGTMTVQCNHDYSGTATSNFVTYVGYYLSTNCTLGGSDILLDYSQTTIGSDPSDPVSKTLTIPANTPPGNYYILFVADYTNTVLEGSNEGNNVYCIPITIEGACSPPTASFYASNGAGQTTIMEGTTTTFTDNSSGGTSRQWVFEDGTSSGSSSVTYTFDTPGTQDVIMTSYNDCGNSVASQKYKVLPNQGGVVDDAGANSPSYPNNTEGDPVNSRSGIFTRTQHMMNLRGRDQNFPFNLEYRSDMNYTGIFGRNVSFNYNYELDMSNTDEFKVRHPNGAVTTYVRYEDDSAIPRYYGMTDTLYKYNGYYFLESKNGTKVQFIAANGRCRVIQDRYNNVIDLTYQNDRLYRIVVPGGKKYFFDYTGDYVTTIRDESGVVRQATLTYSDDNITSITNVRGKTTQFEYTNDLMTKVIDAKGNLVVENTYQSGRVTKQKDFFGNEYLFDTPTSFPGMATITNPNGEIKRIYYDAHKRPYVFEDHEGYRDSVVYNEWHLPTEYYDKKGNKILTYIYEDDYKPIKIINIYNDTIQLLYGIYDAPERLISPTGDTVNVTLDANGNPTNVLLPNSAGINSVFNTWGQATSTTDLRGTTKGYEYNNNGNNDRVSTPTGNIDFQLTDEGFVNAITDRNSRSVEFTLNEFGKMTEWKDAKLESGYTEYDNNGNVQKYTDREGTEYGSIHDERNRLISTSVNGVTKSTYTWDALDRYTSRRDAYGNLRDSVVYNNRGLITQRFNGLGWYTFTHDENGRVMTVQDPMSNTWALERDLLGRLVKTFAPNGNLLSEVTFENGLTKEVKDANQNTLNINHDGVGVVSEVEDAKGGKNTLSTNGASDILSLQNAKNETFQFIRNEFGTPDTIIFPGNDIYTITYGNEGEPLGYKDGNDLESTISHDNNYNPTTISYSNGNIYGFGYDKEDRATSASRNGQTTSFTRNEVGLPTTTQGRFGYPVNYTYDGNYQTQTINYPGGLIVTNEYFSNGLLKKVSDNRGNWQEYTIDALGRYITKTNSNGTSVSTGRNDKGEVITYVNQYADGTIIYADTLTYDANGNTTNTVRVNQLNPNFTNTSDMLETYTYGNADQQITATPDWTRTFDGNGAVLTEMNSTTSNTFTYIENNLCNTANFNGHTIVNEYNGLQMRDTRTVDGVTTKYVLDERNSMMPYVLEERNNEGTLLRSYVYGNGRLLWMVENTNTYFYHFDKVGHTRAITDENANLVQRYGMDIFGGFLNKETEFEQPFIFMGEYGVVQDVEGLINVRKRYYSTQSFRFMQRDPYPWNIYNTQSINRYTYALNNPLKWIDPTGYVSGQEDDVSGSVFIVTNDAGDELFRLSSNFIKTQTITVKSLYNIGVQWFEPKADNYMELLSVSGNLGTSNSARHFTWDDIVEFAETERPNSAYLEKQPGDWKESSEGGAGYYLVVVGGMPYWGDAIGQIPFSVDVYTDLLEETGDEDFARKHTIGLGKRFANGIPLTVDKTNSYDNAMIVRAINWASNRYELGNQLGGWSNYELINTGYSSSNLAF